MWCSSGSLEDQNAHRNVNSEVAEGNEESSKDQDRERSCYILAKTLAIFHPRPQILSKDELKKKLMNKLISSGKFQDRITRVLRWLVAADQFSQIESECGQGRAERSEKHSPGGRACLKEQQGRESKSIDRTRQLTAKDIITIRLQALDRENRKAVSKARSLTEGPQGVKMQIHLKAEKVSSLGYLHPRFPD